MEAKLPRLGLYEISFYVLMYCDSGEECVDANDYLSISYLDDKQQQQRDLDQELAKIKITDLEKQNKWERKVIHGFEIKDESQKEVNVIFFSCFCYNTIA